jgi:hypothetical protein
MTHKLCRSSFKSALAALAFAPAITGAALAQSTATAPQHVPLQKTIGQAKPEVVPSLIVLNSRGATLADGKLTLTGVSPNAIVFADRPVRAAGHALTVHLLEEWSPENDDSESFAKNPPNATVSVFSKDAAIRDAVIVLKSPKLEGDKLTFDVDVLEGDLANADGPASIFIDRFGFAFAGPRVGVGVGRVGVARVGLWHRPVGWYAGRAAVGAAIGAAAAYPYYGPRCGYYPYPPCY